MGISHLYFPQNSLPRHKVLVSFDRHRKPVLTAGRGMILSVFLITFKATSVRFQVPRYTTPLLKKYFLSNTSTPSNDSKRNLQSPCSNDLSEFNVERAYGPWFNVDLLTTSSQQVSKALREKCQFLLFSFFLLDTPLESSHHSHRILFLYICSWY